MGALFLVLCGLSPKLAAVISIMPQSVLGGAAVMMFSSIIISGFQLIVKYGITNRVITIVSVALGVGYGLGATSGATVGLGPAINLVFGGSGIVPAGLIAVVLNLVIPKGEDDFEAEEVTAHLTEWRSQRQSPQKETEEK
jgi:xanthine/uracil permease